MNFNINNYNINISTNDNTSIYVNIVNKITFQNYETSFVKKDICSFMDINEMFNFMIKCFEKKENYNVDFESSESKLILFFSAKIDGFLNISHKLIVKELILNSDKMLTTRLNSMKEDFQKQIDDLKSELVTIGCLKTPKPFEYIRINKYTNVLDLSKYNNNNDIIWTNINQFVSLNELIINDSWIGNHANNGSMTNTIFPLYFNYNFVNNGGHVLSQPHFIDIFNFPQITVLEIQKLNGFQELGYFYNVPNLVELRLINFDKDLNILQYIQTIPKLKKFKLIKCNYITSSKIIDIREYCVKQKIQFIVE
jgi:hypothetical protein